jgi:hypothetical protein
MFFLQKQDEKKAALELRKKREEAVMKAHLTRSPANPSPEDLPNPTAVLRAVPTSKPKPTSMLPKPTPMLPKPTPMLQQTP